MDLSVANALVRRACPSIVYRIRREILGEEPASAGMRELQNAILKEPEVLRVISLRKEDGWLGGSFHGRDEPESAIRYLMEKGVEPGHPAVQCALRAILSRGSDFDRGSLERVGKALDTRKLGGSNLIRACVFAYAGEETYAFVAAAAEEALEVFQAAAAVNDVRELYEDFRGHKVFRPGVLWPSIYHLRLLAFTRGWRTGARRAMLCSAAENIARLSPIPEIKLNFHGQIVSPASAGMNDFRSDPRALTGGQKMMWFHRMELLARLGVVAGSETLASQLRALDAMLFEGGGYNNQALRHPYFTKWTAYTGLALESDWRTGERRINDLTFRCLLIRRHAETS